MKEQRSLSQRAATLLSWVWGVVFLLMSLVEMRDSLLSALAWVGVALLLLPPVRALAYDITKCSIPTAVRALLIIGLLFTLPSPVERHVEHQLGGPPDVKFVTPVAFGPDIVDLTVAVRRATGERPCMAHVQAPIGVKVGNWVRPDGRVTRLATPIARACTGRPDLYIAAVNRATENKGPSWEESAGPDYAPTAADPVYDVHIDLLSSRDALLTVAPRSPSESLEDDHPRAHTLSRNEVLQARQQFQVEVLSFDLRHQYGSQGKPRSNKVRVRVTNNSEVTLPQLTVKTSRFDSAGNLLGWSRNPPLDVSQIQPGASAELDYYPVGALPGAATLSIEIEANLSPEDERFIHELKAANGNPGNSN